MAARRMGARWVACFEGGMKGQLEPSSMFKFSLRALVVCDPEAFAIIGMVSRWDYFYFPAARRSAHSFLPLLYASFLSAKDR